MYARRKGWPLDHVSVDVHHAKVHAQDAGEGIRIRELARLAGARENSLVGYGLITGLARTGDSARSEATLQSIRNTLLRYGVNDLRLFYKNDSRFLAQFG